MKQERNGDKIVMI